MARRRTVPNTPPEPEFLPSEPIAGIGLEDPPPPEFDPDMPPQMAFFAKLREYQPEQWGDTLKLYLYRIDPPVANAGDKKYIDWFPRMITEAEIQERHGGGKYQLWLRDESVKPAKITKCTFYIDGPAKFLPGQTLRGSDAPTIDAATGAAIHPAAPGAATASDSSTKAMADVLNRALDLLQQGKSTTADEAIQAAMKTLATAQQGALQIVMDSVKSQAGSQTGNPLLDKILEASLAKLVAPPEPKSQIEIVKEAFSMVRELRDATGMGDAQQPERRGGLVEEIKAIAELKKVDEDGSLIKTLLGRDRDDDDEREDNSLAMKGLGILERVLNARPDIIDSGANLLKRLAGPGPQTYAATAAQQPAPPQQLAGTVTPAPSAPAAASSSVPAATTPAQEGEALPANVDAVLQTIVQSYHNNMDGSAVAAALATLYPDTIPVLRQYLGFPDPVVNAWLSTQPAIAPLMKDSQFPEFFARFKAAIEGTLVEEEEEEDFEGDGEEEAGPEGVH